MACVTFRQAGSETHWKRYDKVAAFSSFLSFLMQYLFKPILKSKELPWLFFLFIPTSHMVWSSGKLVSIQSWFEKIFLLKLINVIPCMRSQRFLLRQGFYKTILILGWEGGVGDLDRPHHHIRSSPAAPLAVVVPDGEIDLSNITVFLQDNLYHIAS